MFKRAIVTSAVAAALGCIWYYFAVCGHHPSSTSVLKIQHTPRGPAQNAAKVAANPSRTHARVAQSYSPTMYERLRVRYKPTGVVANGPMPKKNIKMTARMVKNALMQGKYWPVVRNVMYGKATAVENSLDTGLSADTSVFLATPFSANVSLLDLAIMTGQRKVIGVLLSHDASVNLPDLREIAGRTVRYVAPLPTAAQYGEDDVVRMLLQRGANIEQKSNNFMNHVTALAAAVDTSNVATTYLLLTHGANVNSALNHDGTVPQFLIEDPTPSEIALRRLLVQYGAKMPPTQ